MTRLLVSVRDADEAREASLAGVDLVDLKEPTAGPLGAVPPELWSAIQKAVGGRAPLSVALGELADPTLADRLPKTTGFTFAKLGLAGMASRADWRERWRDAWSRLPADVRPVAVAYADAARCDAPTPEQIVATAPACGCVALLVDTAVKRPGESLFQHLPPTRLRELVATARDQGLLVVLAGSIRQEHLLDALALDPDYVAVRGAVCRGPRDGRLDASLVRDWVRAVAEHRQSFHASTSGS